MKLKHIIIFFYYCALIGSQFPIAPGVSWMDVFCIPLLIYVLANTKRLNISEDIIARTSIVYAIIMIASGILNTTLTNTVFVNFTRNFIEGIIAYLALSVSLKGEKEIIRFSYLSFFYAAAYLLITNISILTSIEYDANFSGVSSDVYGGRNGMAVTNLLVIILLTYHIFFWKNKKANIVLVLFPFLVFNIIFSASRFSVISLVIFIAFVILFMSGRMKMSNKIILILFLAVIPYLVSMLESRMDSGVMSYSSELLQNKITKNEDGGFAYRLNDLNFLVIKNWLNVTPAYSWLFGDGISITHGIFSFTFCATGLVGFLYFIISHLKMIVVFWKRKKYEKYIAALIFIFILNDIVTNSRFIIGMNTMIYMGMLAYFNRSTQVVKIGKQ